MRAGNKRREKQNECESCVTQTKTKGQPREALEEVDRTSRTSHRNKRTKSRQHSRHITSSRPRRGRRDLLLRPSATLLLASFHSAARSISPIMILRAISVFSALAQLVQVTPFTVPVPTGSSCRASARCRETQCFQSKRGGKGFGRQAADSGSFVSFDRFRAECPADLSSVRQFDSSLVGDELDEACWVAVYRTANNLPSVFVKDAFLDAMKAATTTVQGGDSETLVSTSAEDNSVVISNRSDDAKPVAVARLAKDQDSNNYILDKMRCILKKENTDDDCDGGSEHAEAIGICIDELVVNYLRRCVSQGDEVDQADRLQFDGGIHFRGTLVSGRLLEARGFREVTELTKDLHSHESDFEGALGQYAARSTSKEIAKNVGARDRALKIVSYLSRIDRDEEKEQLVNSSDDDDAADEADYDPWASVKRFI